MRRFYLGALLRAPLFCFAIVGCQPRGTITEKVPELVKRERVVDYRETSVPEEGGIKFTKFTEENEAVMGPKITAKEGVISWYSPSLIAVSPDGNQVAYTAKKEDKTNIFIKNTLGGRSTIQRTFRDYVLDMSYSPDGKYIIFTEDADDNYNILQINATQGAAIQQISATSYRESAPVYSSDGNMIYYTQGEYVTSLSDYRYYIWSIDPNTFLKTQWSEGFNPSLSAGNKDIVVVCRNNKQNGKGEIYTIDLKTGQETLILSDPEKGFSSPQIHPNGKTIVCVGTTLASKQRKENLDIYTVAIDGTRLTQLTFHPGHDVSPVWSPKGDEIYFLCQRGNQDGSWDVWKMDYQNR
jgi:Tol biopolymer transport system component